MTVNNLETLVLNRCGSGNCRQVTVQRNQTTCRTQSLQYLPTVSATPEGTVDVDTRWLNGKRIDGFIEQNRDMCVGVQVRNLWRRFG